MVRSLYHCPYHHPYRCPSGPVYPQSFVGVVVSCFPAPASGCKGLAPRCFATPCPWPFPWQSARSSRATDALAKGQGQGLSPLHPCSLPRARRWRVGKLSPPRIDRLNCLAIAPPFAIQGSAGGGDWCVSREALFYPFPHSTMEQWIDRTFGSTDDFPCVHQQELGDLRLKVFEYNRKCGLYGYIVDLFLLRDDDEPSQIGCFGWTDLPIVIQLMQTASDAIAARTGVRPLHTVRLWNKTFFLDEKLRMLRNVEDPHDSVELT